MPASYTNFSAVTKFHKILQLVWSTEQRYPVVMVQMSQQYQQYFLQPMMQYVCDKQGEVRQAAAYGIGVMAQFGGQGYLQAYTGMPTCLYMDITVSFIAFLPARHYASAVFATCLSIRLSHGGIVPSRAKAGS